MYWNCSRDAVICCRVCRQCGSCSGVGPALLLMTQVRFFGILRCVDGNLTYSDVPKKRRLHLQDLMGSRISYLEPNHDTNVLMTERAVGLL